ncbi:MAG: T9SS type A sorting domain-containing protein [Ignavibacteriaceae bacterium]|nr:T9SS type A sorting domain-containing protein [Ignavibacteriaceae bacterium]
MGGILCTNSNPVITHCRISYNRARLGGPTIAGGIALNNSNAEISWCEISYNRSGIYGGGITITNSSPRITGCNIIANYTVERGGGIYIAGSSNPVITDCTIKNDTSNMDGGGITVTGGVVTISECTIGYNKANDGGGIWINGGSVFLDHCIIEHNICWTGPQRGGGIFAIGGSLTLDHCTLYGNILAINENGTEIYTGGNAAMIIENCIFLNDLSYLIVFGSTSPASVLYNDFKLLYTSPPYYFFGNVPSGLGALTQINANGDSCDIYKNIYLDPLFEDPGAGNYQITWTNWPTPDSTKSPCIDAGDPLFPFDPDGTITDMGVFPFDQSIPVELVSFTAELIDDNVSLKWITATETNNSGFEIQRKSDDVEWGKIGFVEGHGTTTELSIYSYSDNLMNIKAKSLSYRLKQIDFNGSFEYSQEIVVEIAVPLEFALGQNFPNPFNPSTKIKYSVPQASKVQIKVFDVLGNEIETLVNEEKDQGVYTVNFDANNLASGLYLYRIQASSFIATKKMILLK